MKELGSNQQLYSNPPHLEIICKHSIAIGQIRIQFHGNNLIHHFFIIHLNNLGGNHIFPSRFCSTLPLDPLSTQRLVKLMF